MKPISILYFLTALFLSPALFSQTTVDDPEIKKMVLEIKSSNLESIVRKLVSFGTRHSISETESDTRGVGEAQRWIKA
jgi:hypothetical protein